MQKRRKKDLEEINLAVNQRCEAIQGELKHMLSSLLERSSKRIILDRIVKEDKFNTILINKENEVLEEVRIHFESQFRKRKSQEDYMSSKWKNIYSPIQEIDSEIYNDLDTNISEEEWTEALKNTKSKSAPGLSGISYPLIKKVGSLTQKVFRHLAHLCIQDGEILLKWKFSKLYPIPKGED